MCVVVVVVVGLVFERFTRTCRRRRRHDLCC
jgi:hypothetical protein